MSSRKILGADAWRAAATKPLSRWFDDTQRFHNDLAKVRHEPKFSLGMDDKFFCIGSCFARNIEEHLIYRGVEVLSKRIFSPKSECAARVNGFVNKFTPQSMFNEIDWALCAPIIDERLFEEGTSGWSDLQLSPGIP